MPLPASRARPIALILTLLENHLCAHLTNDVIENPFPNLNHVGKAAQSDREAGVETQPQGAEEAQ